MKILGLCGSPVKKGNAYVYLEKALEPIQGTGPEIEIVEGKIVEFHRLRIPP